MENVFEKGSKSIANEKRQKLSKMMPRFNRGVLIDGQEHDSFHVDDGQIGEMNTTQAQKGGQVLNLNTLKTYSESPFNSIQSADLPGTAE